MKSSEKSSLLCWLCYDQTSDWQRCTFPERLRSSAAAPADPRPAAAHQPPGLLALCPPTASLFVPFSFQHEPTHLNLPSIRLGICRTTSTSQTEFSAALPSLITYFLCQILVVSDLPSCRSTTASHASTIDRALSRSSSFCPSEKWAARVHAPGLRMPRLQPRQFFLCCHNYPSP